MDLIIGLVIGLAVGASYPGYIKPALSAVWSKLKGLFDGNP